MTLVATLTIGCLLVILGRLLVSHLGWPTTLEGAGRWGLSLLALAVLISGLPELWNHISPRMAPLPPVEVPELVGTLLLVGLGVLGYVAWTRGKEEKESGREKLGPRRRALPPPPTTPDGFDPTPADDFAPLNHDDQDIGH